MSELRLKEFYTYVELPLSTKPQDIDALRKILLLQLKSSNDSALHIAGNQYSKQDILEFLKGEFSPENPTLENLLNAHPILRIPYTPNSIERSVHDIVEQLNEEEIQLLKSYYASINVYEFKKALIASIRTYELKKSLAFLSYLPLFETPIKVEVQFKARLAVLDLVSLNRGNNKRQFMFVTQPSYYELIGVIHDREKEFLVQQLKLSSRFLVFMNYKDVQKYFSYQLELEFLEFVKDQLREQAALHSKRFVRKNHKVYIRRQRQNNLAIVVGVVVFLALIIWLFYIAATNP